MHSISSKTEATEMTDGNGTQGVEVQSAACVARSAGLPGFRHRLIGLHHLRDECPANGPLDNASRAASDAQRYDTHRRHDVSTDLLRGAEGNQSGVLCTANVELSKKNKMP